jgi:hypothetical protein
MNDSDRFHDCRATAGTEALRDEFERFLRDVKAGCAKPERTALLDGAIERAEMILGPGLPSGPHTHADPGRAGEVTTLGKHDGLVLHGHWLAYGMDHGFGMWIPYRIQRLIVHAWNRVACILIGHDTLTQDHEGGPCTCISCLRVVPDPGPDGDVLRDWTIPWDEVQA